MRVLDLFAGTGGLGIEALVRGARRVVFVEDHPAQCHAIQRALQRLEFASLAQVRCEDVLAALRRIGSTGETFDLALLDPPYGQGWIDRTLEAIRESGTLLTNALVVAEGHWRDRPELVPGFMLVKEARYGETALWYIRIEGVS
jgi:16S rRNA (guanine966-N2)-methyltransferase